MRRRRILTPLVLLAVLAASCADHGDATGGDSEPQAGGPTTAEATAKPGQFGTMTEPVCGPGSGGSAGGQGVTATAIKVGVAGDAANTIVPDVNKEMYDASEAFVAWCNAAGGINGRKIEMTKRDGELLKVGEAVTKACAEDFALVGGGWALDADAAAPRTACGLVEFPGFTVSPDAREAAKQVQAIPFYKTQMPVTQYHQIAKAFPGAIANFGLMTTVAMGSKGRPFSTRLMEAIGPLGYKLVYNEELPPPIAPIDNWRPYVESMKSKGVKVLDFQVTPEYLIPLLKSMRDANWYPDTIILPANFYNQSLIEAGNALKNVFVSVYSEPFIGVDPDKAAVKQFLEILNAQSSEWKQASLAVNSFSAWLLFAKSAKECGAQLTRECVEQKGLAVGTWDGGGLHAPGKPNTKSTPQPNQCGLLMTAAADGFSVDAAKTAANEGIYNCSTKNSVAVPL
jgi:ABC-type branched-subunit amino acid transport system substrate-binding protein